MIEGNSRTEPQPPGWVVWIVRAFALVFVVPLKLAWDLLKAGWRRVRAAGSVLARFLRRYLLDPLAAVVRAVAGLLVRFLLRPVGACLRVVAVLVGRGLAAVGRVLRVVLLTPLAWCWRALVAPPLLWVLRLFAAVLGWVARRVGRALAALARLVRDAVTWAVDRVAAPLGRLLARAWRSVVVTPVRWVHRTLLKPVIQAVRWSVRTVLVTPLRWAFTPVRLAGRRIRAQLRAAFGRHPRRD